MLLALVGTRVAIGWFTRHGFGQPIRQDGPTSHLVKRGTPTMGGLVIIASAAVGYLAATGLTRGWPSASGWLALGLLVSCGLIGFADDFIKVYTQNNAGLSGRWKIAGQTAIALAFGLVATQLFADERGVHPASLHLSATQDFGVKLPLVVVLLVIWFLVTATSNATNLTDGADGLLAGATVLAFSSYLVVNVWQNKNVCGSVVTELGHCYDVRDPLDLAVFCAAVAAAALGFLWWNAKPARIMMGDVGSLAIGGALAGIAIMSRTEVLLAVIGCLFVIETMSVIIQTSWFKLTRRVTGTPRRLFRITPIHHHFEHAGWDEVTVVIRFWLVAALGAAAGLGIFYASWLGL